MFMVGAYSVYGCVILVYGCVLRIMDVYYGCVFMEQSTLWKMDCGYVCTVLYTWDWYCGCVLRILCRSMYVILASTCELQTPLTSRTMIMTSSIEQRGHNR